MIHAHQFENRRAGGTAGATITTITEVYLDAAALVLPVIAIWRLFSHKAALWGVKGGNLARLNLYFVSAVSFDIVRNLGFAWASLGIQISAGFIFAIAGFIAASLYFCPEANSLPEAWKKLRFHSSVLLYQAIVVIWVALNIFLPSLYLSYTLVVLVAGAVYPTMLFSAARNRAKPPHVKNALSRLSISWGLFVTLGTFLFVLGDQPPVLPVSLDFGWGLAFLSGSIMFFSMSFVEANPFGSVRFPTSQLIPESIIKPGQKYLILHDSGKRAITLISSTLRTLIDSGARVVINGSSNSWLVGGLSQNEPHFADWKKTGRLLITPSGQQDSPREGLSERLSFGPTSLVVVEELGEEGLRSKVAQENDDGSDKTRIPQSELYLLESSKAPRSQLSDFLQENSGMELLNLSESTESFSSQIGLDHEKIRGSISLLEYDSSSDIESAVDKFLQEGISNAEICVLFTTKSSRLYRAIKGKRMIKIIAASSLISAPDELPDGEMQIPDKELGLVAAIVSDYLDNSKNSGASFVFDSITDLIRGERWEQVFAGIRQLIDLLTVPNITALFLANSNTMEPRFLGALRGAFAIQLGMDSYGLRATKVPSR
ncbi:MAG TPA: hypothetical protein VFJ63_00205 [Candidatus Bathyarchaeia archaeon]|nr:hypothetical protein [Candidatus Bathyarchaeia archaeon]